MLILTPEILAFRASESLRAGLAQELQGPAIQAAIKALDTLARPRSIPDPQPGVPHDTTIAHRYCECVGASNVLRALRSMTYSAEDRAPDEADSEEEPFANNLPESLRNRSRK
jgi:hypothetical protein